jgi:predicted Rossmann fold nucleotide-binding protein DprA/Smf involved in DNA uptake
MKEVTEAFPFTPSEAAVHTSPPKRKTPDNRSLVELAALTELFRIWDPRNAFFYEKMRKRILVEASRSTTNDEQTVLRAVKSGAATVTDVASCSGIPPNTAQQHLTRLLAQRLVIRRRAPIQPGNNGGDKRTYLYWPAE